MSSHPFKIGLALGGGAARGSVHVGVLSVLTAAGIPIDFVGGTSVGSFVGAAYCAGMSVDRMRALALTTGWKQLSRPVVSRDGLLSFDPLEAWVESQLGDVELCDLATPLAIVTTDLAHGEKVVFREGPLARLVHASCAVPGVAKPVAVNGRLLCDGGVVDNLPVDVVRAMGADYVIGVDIFMPSNYHRLGALGTGLMSIETMIRNSGGPVSEADCLIAPEIAGHSYHRFSKSLEYIERGAEAARQMLPTIRAALADNQRLTVPC
ncbi:MAG: patatin-like phospholipase family protein [Anaerolineales bacterium]|nr:patatin-like phospholipase family protein [Anaerolineales bacterium]